MCFIIVEAINSLTCTYYHVCILIILLLGMWMVLFCCSFYMYNAFFLFLAWKCMLGKLLWLHLCRMGPILQSKTWPHTFWDLPTLFPSSTFIWTFFFLCFYCPCPAQLDCPPICFFSVWIFVLEKSLNLVNSRSLWARTTRALPTSCLTSQAPWHLLTNQTLPNLPVLIILRLAHSAL